MEDTSPASAFERPSAEAEVAPPAPPPPGVAAWMGRIVPIAIAVLALAIGGAVLLSAAPTQAPLAANTPYSFDPGMPAPEFSLQTVDGQTLSLSDLRGKAVMVNFWATWCPPCRAEMPDMQQVYAERGSSDIAILAVNVQEAAELVNQFVARYGLKFPILMDPSGNVFTAYRVSSLPTSYFVDREGRIASVNVGALNRQGMVKQLDAALQARN